jgi:hypothetical protein
MNNFNQQLIENQRKLEKEVAKYVDSVDRQISLLTKLQNKILKKVSR